MLCHLHRDSIDASTYVCTNSGACAGTDPGTNAGGYASAVASSDADTNVGTNSDTHACTDIGIGFLPRDMLRR